MIGRDRTRSLSPMEYKSGERSRSRNAPEDGSRSQKEEDRDETCDEGIEIESFALSDNSEAVRAQLAKLRHTSHSLVKRALGCCKKDALCTVLTDMQLFNAMEKSDFKCPNCTQPLTLKTGGLFNWYHSHNVRLMLTSDSVCPRTSNVRGILCHTCHNIWRTVLHKLDNFESVRKLLFTPERVAADHCDNPNPKSKIRCTNSGGNERILHQWRAQSGFVAIPTRKFKLDEAKAHDALEDSLYRESRLTKSKSYHIIKAFANRKLGRVEEKEDQDRYISDKTIILNLPLSSIPGHYLFAKATPLRWKNFPGARKLNAFQKVSSSNFVLSCELIEAMRWNTTHSSFAQFAADWIQKGKALRFDDVPEPHPDMEDEEGMLEICQCYTESKLKARESQENRRTYKMADEALLYHANSMIQEGKQLKFPEYNLQIKIRDTKGSAYPVTEDYIAEVMPDILRECKIIDPNEPLLCAREIAKKIYSKHRRGFKPNKRTVQFAKLDPKKSSSFDIGEYEEGDGDEDFGGDEEEEVDRED